MTLVPAQVQQYVGRFTLSLGHSQSMYRMSIKSVGGEGQEE